MNVNAMAKSRDKYPLTESLVSRPPWTDREKRLLVHAVGRIEKKLKRSVRPQDLRKVNVAGRSFSAIKSQASRLGLYEPTRNIRPWNDTEKHILVILGQKRRLGARAIKARGFFGPPGKERQPWAERSVDSIAQKKRREGLVDANRSLRARLARRLGDAEKRKLHKELRENPCRKSTEDFAREYGVAPSTIRAYRKRWRIKHSWQIAMSLPAARFRRKQLAEDTRARNAVFWKKRKARLLANLRKERQRRLGKTGRKSITWRTCQRCGMEWPATKRFFAPSPKRRGGEIIARYLRRTCRVCPRRPESR